MMHGTFDEGPLQMNTVDDITLFAFNQLLAANHEMTRQRDMLVVRAAAKEEDNPSSRACAENPLGLTPGQMIEWLRDKNTALEITLRETRKKLDLINTPRDSDQEMIDGMNRYAGLSAQWVQSTFGKAAQMSKEERALRFAEEAIELLQACGVRRGQVEALAKYVYNRPVGEPAQEVGGVMATLAPLADSLNAPLGDAAVGTLKLCWARQDEIREKNLNKPVWIKASIYNNEGDGA